MTAITIKDGPRSFYNDWGSGRRVAFFRDRHGLSNMPEGLSQGWKPDGEEHWDGA